MQLVAWPVNSRRHPHKIRLYDTGGLLPVVLGQKTALREGAVVGTDLAVTRLDQFPVLEDAEGALVLLRGEAGLLAPAFA